MTSKHKCIICRTSDKDVLNLGEMKTYENITAHYYCLLLASTITQSGEDDEGILGFLPNDIRDEVKRSQKRECVYCKQKGATVLCATRSCKIMFHLPCGIKNNSGHQFHGRFYSNCRTHRPKQKYKKPSEPQTCSICYESVNFEGWPEILWAPCCKKQSFFHKTCIQQMALSAGYFFKCPMCNNSEVFQKAMKHHGVFIPDRDASWELEPNAFEELLYRHTECNAKICLCKSGRKYDNLGPWNIVLCNTCGSQGTHRHCSKLKKNDVWICELCVVEKKSDNKVQTQVINGLEIIPIYQPSTSQAHPVDIPQVPNNIDIQSKPKKRKRNRSLRSSTTMKHDSKNYFIDVDSEDSDVVVIEDEPNTKCLIAQDRSLLKVHNRIKQTYSNHEDIDIENQDSTSCTDFMNLVITDVRSLSETNDNFIENKITPSKPFASNDFKNIQKKISTMSDHYEEDDENEFLVLQEVVYNNNNSRNQESNNQYLRNTNSTSSSDDIVIID